jgi:hypothetical protein
VATLEGVHRQAGGSVIEADDDIALLAHWLLTRVSTLRFAAARAGVELPGDEHELWLRRVDRMGDEVEQVLGNLARGIPVAIAGLPYLR